MIHWFIIKFALRIYILHFIEYVFTKNDMYMNCDAGPHVGCSAFYCWINAMPRPGPTFSWCDIVQINLSSLHSSQGFSQLVWCNQHKGHLFSVVLNRLASYAVQKVMTIDHTWTEEDNWEVLLVLCQAFGSLLTWYTSYHNHGIWSVPTTVGQVSPTWLNCILAGW